MSHHAVERLVESGLFGRIVKVDRGFPVLVSKVAKHAPLAGAAIEGASAVVALDAAFIVPARSRHSAIGALAIHARFLVPAAARLLTALRAKIDAALGFARRSVDVRRLFRHARATQHKREPDPPAHFRETPAHPLLRSLEMDRDEHGEAGISVLPRICRHVDRLAIGG